MFFDVFYQSLKNKIDYNDFQSLLNDLGCKVEEIQPELIANFPTSINEINTDMKCVLLELVDGLNQDHPGYTDEEYKKRRNEIASCNQDYNILEPIPYMKYLENENNLWKKLYNKLSPMINKYGCKEFKENFEYLQKIKIFNENEIPQLNDIN